MSTDEIHLVDGQGQPREAAPAEVLTEGRPLTTYEQLAETDPLKADAVTVLAAGLIDQAGPMWDALVEVPEEDASKPLLDLIVDQALTAALPLVDP